MFLHVRFPKLFNFESMTGRKLISLGKEKKNQPTGIHAGTGDERVH